MLVAAAFKGYRVAQRRSVARNFFDRQRRLLPLGSTGSAGVQAAWELDLFGGNAAKTHLPLAVTSGGAQRTLDSFHGNTPMCTGWTVYYTS